MNPRTDRIAESGNGEPRVGIFWLLDDGALLLDTTPLADAEPYSDCLTHPRSHILQWEIFLQQGCVAPDIEYEEPPRGRVVYRAPTERFVIYADTCILRRKYLVRKIMTTMHLPKNKTDTSPDQHYRCSQCLHG